MHRIDKDTSGLLVVAKTESAKAALAKQFFDKTTTRSYVALVWGHVENEVGTIVGNIGRSLQDRKQMAVFQPDSGVGKHAVTHYRVLERLGYITMVECRLETGRTHQIRAHFKHIGHTLFNDERYGGNQILKGTTFAKYKLFVQHCFETLPRQALHAKTLGFVHPTTGEYMQFDSEIPADMTQCIEKWRNYIANRQEIYMIEPQNDLKPHVAIVYGGYSSEAVVSEKSLAGLLSFIDAERFNLIPVFISHAEWSAVEGEKRYEIDRSDFSYLRDTERVKVDFAYITIHGEPGENGWLPGYFEMIGLPHSTCPAITSAMTFDKYVCNSYLRGFGIDVADSVMVRKGEQFDSKTIAARLGLPCFVKPATSGSSFGVSKVEVVEDIAQAVEKALTESDKVVIESYLDGVEVTCGLYSTQSRTVVFPLTEVVCESGIFDYDAKYTPGGAKEITPARVPDEVRDEVQRIAKRVYSIMDMKGIARIDFIIVGNRPYLLEVNTTPGMTASSFIPQQIRAAGLPIADVFTEIITDIIERKTK